MNPKEKAEELIGKFWKLPQNNNEIISIYTAKQLAKVLVNEILNTIIDEDFGGHLIDEIGADSYWDKVKEEIDKL